MKQKQKFLQANEIGDALYTQKMSAKDPNYKVDMNKVRAGLLEGDDDDDDYKKFLEKTKQAQKTPTGIFPYVPRDFQKELQKVRNRIQNRIRKNECTWW